MFLHAALGLADEPGDVFCAGVAIVHEEVAVLVADRGVSAAGAAKPYGVDELPGRVVDGVLKGGACVAAAGLGEVIDPELSSAAVRLAAQASQPEQLSPREQHALGQFLKALAVA